MSDRDAGPSLSSRVVLPARVLFRDLGGESVLLDLASGRYYGLDALGTRIWDLLSRGGRLASIHRRLLEDYDVGASRLERDLLALVGELARRGLVEIGPADARVVAAVEEDQ